MKKNRGGRGREFENHIKALADLKIERPQSETMQEGAFKKYAGVREVVPYGYDSDNEGVDDWTL